jgi:pimeloyl-ACP methyl ester carboxylesterase
MNAMRSVLAAGVGKFWLGLAVGVSIALASLGCSEASAERQASVSDGGTEETPRPAASPDASADVAQSARLHFHPCPEEMPGKPGGRRCATSPVPLRWSEPEGEQIELMVVRYAAETPSAGQLWLLDGGPGGTGGLFMLPEVLALYQSFGFDIYVPQHRGTGFSTPLHCDDGGVDLLFAPQADLVAACGAELVATWGEGLRGFHSDEAGRDLGALIERTGKDEPTFVYGVSYGSYWAQRYLQAFPDQSDGMILQGVFPLGEHIWEVDALADAAGGSLFQACREQDACREAFEGDPEDAAHRVVAKASDPNLRCLGEAGPDRHTLELWFSLIITGDIGQAIPGLIRRMDRCNDQDQAELQGLSALLGDALGEGAVPIPDFSNDALGVHVGRTDLMAELETLPTARLEAERDPLVFWSAALTLEDSRAYVENWPVHYPPVSNEIPEHTTKVLLMNGGLDIQTPTPWARSLSLRLNAELVEFPYVGHGVDLSLPNLPGGAVECSLGIEQAFLSNPEATLDTSCAATAYVPDLLGESEENQYLAQLMYGGGSLIGE